MKSKLYNICPFLEFWFCGLIRTFYIFQAVLILSTSYCQYMVERLGFDLNLLVRFQLICYVLTNRQSYQEVGIKLFFTIFRFGSIIGLTLATWFAGFPLDRTLFSFLLLYAAAKLTMLRGRLLSLGGCHIKSSKMNPFCKFWAQISWFLLELLSKYAVACPLCCSCGPGW